MPTTIREAIKIALEAVPDELVNRAEVRRLVCLYAYEFAFRRGLIMGDEDFEGICHPLIDEALAARAARKDQS